MINYELQQPEEVDANMCKNRECRKIYFEKVEKCIECGGTEFIQGLYKKGDPNQEPKTYFNHA